MSPTAESEILREIRHLQDLEQDYAMKVNGFNLDPTVRVQYLQSIQSFITMRIDLEKRLADDK